EPVRAAAARMAGVIAIPRLEAVFDLTRRGRDGLHVRGNVSATVRQSCVVTLEPVENEVEETVDVIFAQPGNADSAADIAVGAPEPPEPLIDGAVDLGAVAIEILMLAIDPYRASPWPGLYNPPTSCLSRRAPFALFGPREPRPGPVGNPFFTVSRDPLLGPALAFDAPRANMAGAGSATGRNGLPPASGGRNPPLRSIHARQGP